MSVARFDMTFFRKKLRRAALRLPIWDGATMRAYRILVAMQEIPATRQ